MSVPTVRSSSRAPRCTACGAVNHGTNYCEACGTPAGVAPARAPRRWPLIGIVSAALVVTGVVVAVATISAVNTSQPVPFAVSSNAVEVESSATPTPNPTEAPSPAAVEPVAPPLPQYSPQDPAAFASSFGSGVDFDSPSGNIHCGIFGEAGALDYFGCSIDEYTWLDPEPTGEALECAQMIHYGGGFIVYGSGPVEVLCRGGVMFAGEIDEAAVLPYGTSLSYAGVICESAESGVNCRALSTGSGFELSRSEFSMF